MKQVKPLYMNQGGLYAHRAVVTRVGVSEINKKRYQWVQLDETIFHPKGGGQPADEGTINGIRVAHVHKETPDKSRLDQFEIFHCFEEGQQLNFGEGDQVELKIDPVVRMLHTRLHTAGHLVAEAVNRQFPALEAYQGHHYPQGAYVKFKIAGTLPDREEMKAKITAQLKEWIAQDLSVSSLVDTHGLRSIKITQDWGACGGTHLDSLTDLGSVDITDISVNNKEAVVTVKYGVGS